MVASLLATTAFWVRISGIFQKYKMGDISKGVANTLNSPPKLTINVPLFKKLRDIIFFGWENHFMSHFEGHFEGPRLF
jgi:hypothetical protein